MADAARRPTCKASGRPLDGWGNYRQRVVQVLDTVVDGWPDGQAQRYTADAGMFCSPACAAAYMLAWLDEADSDTMDAFVTAHLAALMPCRSRPSTPDAEPF